MKLLIASFFGDPRLTNAPAQFARTLADAAVEEGFSPSIWTGATVPPPASPFLSGGREVPLTLVPVPKTRRWLGDWRPNAELRDFSDRELARLRPDVVVLSAWRGLSDVALAARDHGIPVVLFLHDYSILCLRRWLLDGEGNLCTGPQGQKKCISCMEKALGRRGRYRHSLCALPAVGGVLARFLGRTKSDHLTAAGTVREARKHMEEVLGAACLLVAQTPRTQQILEGCGVAPERTELALQSLSAVKRIDAVKEKRPRKQPLRFAFLGRWSREKGTDLLLEAFTAADLPEGTELWLVVSNPDTVRLAPMPASSGKRLRLFAGFSGAETSKLLAQVDLCIVPSRCEDLASRAVLEAMDQGVPVVASSSVGNSYLIEDGNNGRIFPSGSTHDLKKILEEIALDPDSLSRWSASLPELPAPESFGTKLVEIVRKAAVLGAAA